MKIIKECTILLILCFIATAISYVLPIPVPSSILSMLLLFLALALHIIKPKNIEHVSKFLLSNMGIFFVPSGVAILKNVNLLAGKITSLLIICLVSTILSFFAAYAVTATCSNFLKKRREKTHE